MCVRLVLVAGALLVAAACAESEAQRGPERIEVRYWVGDGSPESGFRNGDGELARWALELWARQVDPPLELVPVPESEASIRLYWVRADEGLYGETRTRLIDGRPVADVYVRPDLTGLGADIEAAAEADPLFRDVVVYLTCVHETGHAFGLPHTADYADIMYSFQYGGDFVEYFRRFRNRLGGRDDIPAASPLSPADREALVTRQRQR